MKFIIRKAEASDLSAIMKLYEKKEDIPMSSPGKEKRNIFSELLGDESRHILVGEKNGTLCALVSMKIEASFESFFRLSAFITDIRADFNHAEILTAILSRATAVAMENGCEKILLCDNAVNAQSHAVYSICNFTQNNCVYSKKL